MTPMPPVASSVMNRYSPEASQNEVSGLCICIDVFTLSQRGTYRCLVLLSIKTNNVLLTVRALSIDAGIVRLASVIVGAFQRARKLSVAISPSESVIVLIAWRRVGPM